MVLAGNPEPEGGAAVYAGADDADIASTTFSNRLTNGQSHAGALFYSLNKRKYMHSVFHFFVLAGSVCHIVAVWDVLSATLMI